MSWFEYIPPPITSIKNLARDIVQQDTPCQTYRMNLMLARIKASSIITRCPESIDVIMDILKRFYKGAQFFKTTLQELKEVRPDVYFAVEKMINRGDIYVCEPRKVSARRSRKKGIARKGRRKSRDVDS